MDNIEREMIDFVNRNAETKRQEALQRSQSQERINYRREKKKRKEAKIKRAIMTIALCASLATSATITHQFTTKHIENNNAVISTAIAENKIDELIEQYIKKMDMYADKENSIETYLGRIEIEEKDEAKVDYTYDNIENIAKHITEAAKISESETRCVIIAAYKIINEPFREDVISRALARANEQQNENTKYQIPENIKVFLEQNGYENLKEYQLKERENIKDLNATEQYVVGTNRKVM